MTTEVLTPGDMGSITKAFRSFCRKIGIQIVPLTVGQTELLRKYPDLRYRHFGEREALLTQSGQINVREARFLGSLVRQLPEGPIIELGTLFGWSARILTLFKEPERALLTVDNYTWNPFGIPPELHFQTTATILAEAIQSNHVRLVKSDSGAFWGSYAGPPPALVFIDADHSYEAVRVDIAGAKVAGARVICGHDYGNRCPGVVRAVEEAGGVKELVDRLWVLKQG